MLHLFQTTVHTDREKVCNNYSLVQGQVTS